MKYNINASLVQHISSGTEGVLQANRDRQSNKETAINKHFLFFALFFTVVCVCLYYLLYSITK